MNLWGIILVVLTVTSVSVFLVFNVYNDDGSSRVRQAFEANEIIPDVISAPPINLLQVTYEQSKKEVNLGNEVTPNEAQIQPLVTYDADSNKFYSVILADPDATSRSFRHWLAINVPGTDLSKADNISSYVGPAPPSGSGFHRYVFLVYQQQAKINTSAVSTDRPNFSVTNFANSFNLGRPIAGNFFQAQSQTT